MGRDVKLTIKAEKKVFKGEKFWEIKEFSCYNYDDLPFKYFDSLPICYEDKNKLVVVFSDGSDIELHKDWLIADGDMRKVVRVIRYCGHKLHLIDLEIKELKKSWAGTEEFDISQDSYVPKVREHMSNNSEPKG